MGRWVGVDFDGTLAKWGTLEPVDRMVNRIKRWLRDGHPRFGEVEVRIVTARANRDVRMAQDDEFGLEPVVEFCKKHFGRELVITCKKDFEMVELWDDRAVYVQPNTGLTAHEFFKTRMNPDGSQL